MNDGKIQVSLQLVIADAIKQAKAAALAMQKEFGIKGPDLTPTVTTSNKAADSQDKLATKVRATNKALTEQQQRLRDIASGKISPVIPNQQITITGSNASNKTYGPGATIPGGNTGAGLATPARIPQQPGPIVPNPLNNMLRRQMLLQPSFPGGGQFPALPNAQQQPPASSLFKQIGPLIAAAVGTGVGGPLGGAIAGVLTKLNPAVSGVTAAMTALRYAAEQTAQAYERARNIYAKSIQSGLGVGQTVQRGMLASVIGVSEQDIFQYGEAIAQLSGKLESSMRVIAETNATLTAVAWDFKILGENLKAMWAKFAEAVAPAIDELSNLISAITKLITLGGMASLLGIIVGTLIDWFTKALALLVLFPASIALLDTAIIDSLKNISAAIQNYLAGTKIGKMFGVEKVQQPGFKDTKTSYDAFKEILKTLLTQPNKPDAGNPHAFMKQLPTSSWERAGLQIGAGGGVNYQQQTAQATKKTADWLQKLTEAVKANKFNVSQPQGLPSTP